MSYEIYIVKPVSYERTEKINNVVDISWNDNIDDVFISFSFTTDSVLEAGSRIELFEKDDKQSVFYGVITTTSRTSKEFYTYSGFDLGFYLEKNKITKQFKGNTISNAIKSVCSECKIQCDEIPEISNIIVKIYKNEQISKILKELLETAEDKGLKKKYYYDCMNGYVNLKAFTENDNLCAIIANLYKIKSTDSIYGFDIKSSIEEMKNKVQIVTPVTKNKQTGVTVNYTTPDNENTKKYGILQETIEVDSDKKVDYEKTANKKLSELNRITSTITLNVLGNYQMKRGVIIPIRNNILELNDKYLIKASRHNISGTREQVSVSVELYNQ